MEIKHQTFFNLSINMFTPKTIIDYIESCIYSDNNPTILIPLNADCFNISCRNREYRQLLSSGNFPIYPDGAGITKALVYLGQQKQERIVTTDLILHLLRHIQSTKPSYTIGFLGGHDGIAETARQNLNNLFGIDNITFAIEPPFLSLDEVQQSFSPEIEKIIISLNDNPVDILFIGLGCPKQDLLAKALLNKAPCKVILPCGGLFSYYSGHHTRAPLWMQDAGLEWLYRLSLEPKRLWRRYLIGNLEFIFRVTIEKMRLLRND